MFSIWIYIWYYILIFHHNLLFVTVKCNFQHHYSSLQCQKYWWIRIIWWIKGSKEQHLGSVRVFFFKEILFQQCIKLIKDDSRHLLCLEKLSISQICCSFELSIYQKVLKRNCTQQLSTLLIIIKCFLSSKTAYYNDFWRIKWHWRLQ